MKVVKFRKPFRSKARLPAKPVLGFLLLALLGVMVIKGGDVTVPEPAKVLYANCAAARAHGAAPIHVGEPGYEARLDADGDGIACEPWTKSDWRRARR